MKINRSLFTTLSAVTCALLLGLSATSHAAESLKKPAAERVSMASVSTPININTADVAMLAALNGVGDKKAADIVAYREAHGKFGKVEDLLNVKGIGEKTLEKNRSLLTAN